MCVDVDGCASASFVMVLENIQIVFFAQGWIYLLVDTVFSTFEYFMYSTQGIKSRQRQTLACKKLCVWC